MAELDRARRTHRRGERAVAAADPRAAGRTVGSGDGRHLIDPPTWTRIARSLRLSPRELQVTQGVFDGRTEVQIGDRLGISRHTVHMHMERLYHKLQIHSQVALVLRIVSERDSILPRSRMR